MLQPIQLVVPLLVAVAVAATPAKADTGLIVSRTLYPTGSAAPSITPGITVLPNGALAIGDGSFANVFKNETPDPSFGVSTRIIVDRRTLDGSIVASFSPDPSLPLVTSFSSKSELGLNVSQDGRFVTFVGYATSPNTLDASNSNTAFFTDPSNPVTNPANPVPTVARAIGVFDLATGSFTATPVDAYSGNNGRGAVLANNGNFYLAGNAGNSTNSSPLATGTVFSKLSDNTGVQMIANGSSGPTTVVGAVNGVFGNSNGYQRGFSITQLGLAADKTGKDDNFRGITVFNNTLYVSKGSGGNGVNTVYQVGAAGALPTAANAATTPITILPGFPAVTAAAKPDTSTHPFGLWFGDASTLFVADEGDGTTTGGASAGLGEYKLVGGTWSKVATFANGLTNQASYRQGLPWDIFTDGLRNLTGLKNADGSFELWATTATTSSDTSHDLGADPNELVTITISADGAASAFNVLETAAAGERIGGVAIADVTAVPEPESYVLMLSGLGLVGLFVRRRRRR
ncbi:MAG TPA: PEP-CTERM sorting domain-containing protein [Caldimonas sp.]|nr:PEP-CTERM sorting domain-containing protein [Caldimonas sp.]HEX4235987.1 PEP-CTERM sorting domain-containing protein [Caldimonas sp.]